MLCYICKYSLTHNLLLYGNISQYGVTWVVINNKSNCSGSVSAVVLCLMLDETVLFPAMELCAT